MTRTRRQIEMHRQGDACIEVCDAAGRPCAGVPVWVEQETHAFVFGCVAPDLDTPEPERRRCMDRLTEVFNQLTPVGHPTEAGALRVDVPEKVRVGSFLRQLDQLASGGRLLEVWVRGRCVSLDMDGPDAISRENAAADLVASLYTLCFAHPAIRGIIWDGCRDGEARAAGGGLLRRDGAPRPAYRFLHKLIGTIWHSRAGGETDANGQLRFRGFFGDYRVVARIGEAPSTVASFALRAPSSQGNPFRLWLSPL